MLRFKEIVFGPIMSRRLGSSLGINLLPSSGKLCNFDCIYCECGWNADGRTSERMPSCEQVCNAVEEKFKALSTDGVHVDSITFSGSGEATLNPDFPEIVDAVLLLRDKFFPAAAVSVLSNAGTLSRPGVIEALMKVDNPILKLDAGSDSLVFSIDRPSSAFSLAEAVKGMMRFNGDFIMQTMFLRGAQPDFENDEAALFQWMDVVRQVRPRKLMVYTLDRPAPQGGLSKMPVGTMRRLLRPLVDEGFDIQING